MNSETGKGKESTKSVGKHVMLSYNWNNTSQVKQIIDFLSPYIHIWRDKSNLTGAGDLWTEIANAITQSEFVVAVLTPDYTKSDNCTNELNFALNNNIPVVPVFLDPNFRPTGNVGLRTSKLFYLLMRDIVQSPLLFVRHLYAMSFKLRDQTSSQNYSAPCFKYTMSEIEDFIENVNKKSAAQSTDINNNRTLKINNNTKILNRSNDRIRQDENPSISPISASYLASTDSETDNQSNNSSLNVYCVQTKTNGKDIDYTDVQVPYKLGEAMYCKTDQIKIKEDHKCVDNGQKKSKNKLDLTPEYGAKWNRSTDSNGKYSFQIQQNTPDHSEYDLYTRERDDLLSFVCHGKEADIEDADYQEIYEIRPQQTANVDIMTELLFELPNDYLSCFVWLRDDLILAATEKGSFHLVRPMKEKWDFGRFTLKPQFDMEDTQNYKQGRKILVDLCVDAKGHLFLLNRWKLIKNGKNSDENEDEFYKYTIDMYNFNHKIMETIHFIRTLCTFSNEKSDFLNVKKTSSLNPNKTPNSNVQNQSQISNNSIEKSEINPVFTRIYNDEKNNCIILMDSANSKIYWFKKTSGCKRRCLKSQDNSLQSPRALAMSIEDDTETLYVCSNGGLVAFNKNFNIKHDEIKNVDDIFYDSFEHCLLFVDKKILYGGRVAHVNCQIRDKDQNEKVHGSTTFRYKRLHGKGDNLIGNFSRLITSKKYVFILSDRRSDYKSSIFAIDKSKIQSSNS